MTITEQLLLQSQLILAAAMTGIIWLVQFVTYPQFLNVGGSEFDVYHKHHTQNVFVLFLVFLIFVNIFATCFNITI